MKLPVIGLTQGDPNGVGLEVIIKNFQHSIFYDNCIPVLYANPKVYNFHKKTLNQESPSYTIIKDISEAQSEQFNLIVSSNEAFEVKYGEPSENAGSEAFASINRLMQDAKAGKLDAIITAPVDKSTIKTDSGFTGHTGYITKYLDSDSSLMILFNELIRVGLVTEHLPISKVASSITTELILSKLSLANDSLKKDFGIVKPKIAILGLNPHNGDNGTMGNEEQDIIAPAVKEANKQNIFCFGPYSADGFFGTKNYENFDLVLAMYHDQGLIPFKSMAFEDGINYTAGLPVVRTSPDHGTAYDIAGKGIASALSFSNAVFAAIEIFHQRNEIAYAKENPLRISEMKRERFRLEQG